MPSFDEKIDRLTDIQRAFIAGALDAFESTMPIDAIDNYDGGEQIGLYGVDIGDLADETLDALTAAADALAESSADAANREGRAIAARLFWKRDARLPGGTTPALLVRLRAPALEECEDNACAGCAWCDANGITVEPMRAIANLIKRHNTDDSFDLDAENVIEQIERILSNATVPIAFRAAGSRQACKSDLVDIARALGVVTDDRASVETLRGLIGARLGAR
jgi:hypothetical protein